MSCVVCAKSTDNTTKCTKCRRPFCTSCLKHRKGGRCPGCPRPASKMTGDASSNDFDAPGLFGASDGFSYFVFEGTVPYRIVPPRQGFEGWSPQTKRIMGSIQQNFNPNDQGEDDLDDAYRRVLAEYRCHGEARTTGHCEQCGLEIWEPSWEGGNAFDEPDQDVDESRSDSDEPIDRVPCEVDDHVMATWKSMDSSEYAATVVAINDDGTLNLAYDDGSQDPAAPPAYVRSIVAQASEQATGPLQYEAGDRVMATWKSTDSAEYAATILAVNNDGTLDLAYDDGSKDPATPAAYIRSVLPQAAAVPAQPAPTVTYAAGDRVMATWKSVSSSEYAATILAVNDDGTLNLAYDDGSKDPATPVEYIRSVNST